MAIFWKIYLDLEKKDPSLHVRGSCFRTLANFHIVGKLKNFLRQACYTNYHNTNKISHFQRQT